MRFSKAVLFLVFLGAMPAWADNGTATTTTFNGVGLGVMVGQDDGHTEGGAALEASVYGIHEKGRYGEARSRIELGTGVGVASMVSGGQMLLGKSLVNIGVEPLNHAASLNTNDNRKDFIEWNPSLALLLNVTPDSFCSLAAVARAGAGVGTLNKSGVGYSYGGGVYANCAGLLLGTIDQSRTERHGRTTDIASGGVDMALIALPGLVAYVGVRGEKINERDDSKGAVPGFAAATFKDAPGDRTEKRVLGVVTAAF